MTVEGGAPSPPRWLTRPTPSSGGDGAPPSN
jgi:hypothetical protein